MKEIWKDYTYGNLDYKVSNYGRVVGKGRGRELKQRINEEGYIEVTMGSAKCRTRVRVHRLVAILFVENPNPELYIEVNHIDRNRANPRADNLEWMTHEDNVKYSYEQGGYDGVRTGSKNGRANLTDEQVIKIRQLYKDGITQKELSVIYGVGWSTIHNIVFNLTWKHLL